MKITGIFLCITIAVVFLTTEVTAVTGPCSSANDCPSNAVCFWNNCVSCDEVQHENANCRVENNHYIYECHDGYEPISYGSSDCRPTLGLGPSYWPNWN